MFQSNVQPSMHVPALRAGIHLARRPISLKDKLAYLSRANIEFQNSVLSDVDRVRMRNRRQSPPRAPGSLILRPRQSRVCKGLAHKRALPASSTLRVLSVVVDAGTSQSSLEPWRDRLSAA